MFEHVEVYPGDPILGLLQTFLKDTRPGKINLGIGVYYDEQGRLPRLKAVDQAEERLFANRLPCSYQPMEGAKNYREALQALLFGKGLDRSRTATVQTLGGSGALKVGADFLKRYFPASAVWVSDPTWDNHVSIFEGAGFTVNRYPWYVAGDRAVRFDAMLACIAGLPARSIVLLHPCCHNPTGTDLSKAQWDQLIGVMVERELIAFMDIAYQGFGDGLDDDAHAIRAMQATGTSFMVANSFSKIFSLYGERCGGLSVVCSNETETRRVLGQLQSTIRRNYSSPPTHGGQLIATVLQDASLNSLWQQELAAMRERIRQMRKALFDVLSNQLPDNDFGYLLSQKGMFSYTGLTPAQIDYLRERHAIYLVQTSRMCVAGLNQSNVEHIAQAFVEAIRSA